MNRMRPSFAAGRWPFTLLMGCLLLGCGGGDGASPSDQTQVAITQAPAVDGAGTDGSGGASGLIALDASASFYS